MWRVGKCEGGGKRGRVWEEGECERREEGVKEKGESEEGGGRVRKEGGE